MAKKKTKGGALIYFVLDKSGSMGAIRDATIAGVNTFLNETKAADPKALISMLLFDTDVTQMYDAVPLVDIEPLTALDYRPGGGTALLDGVGIAIRNIEKMDKVPEKVIVAVLTDGQENGSHEYTCEAVKALVSQHEDEHDWQFLFLGANLDSFAEAGAIGVRAANRSLNWVPSAAGASTVYAVASAASNDYLMGNSASVNLVQSDYDNMLNNVDPNPTIDQKINQRAQKAQRNLLPTKP